MRSAWLLGAILLASPASAEATKVCVIVGAESSQIRRVVVPDNDSQIEHACTLGKGEALVIADRDDELTAAVEKATGKAPTVPMAAVVEDGVVTEIKIADSAVDTPKGKEWIAAYPGVAPGQTYDKATGTFIAPLQEVMVAAGEKLPDGTTAAVDTTIEIGGPVEKPEEPVKMPPMTVDDLNAAVRK